MAKLILTNLQVKEKNDYNKDNFIIIKSLGWKYEVRMKGINLHSVNNITSKYLSKNCKTKKENKLIRSQWWWETFTQ